MTADSIPSIDAFLNTPRHELQQLMPATVIYTPGGTRRDAILHGIDPSSDDYPRWSRNRIMDCASLLFAYGVKHLFLLALWPRQYAETGAFGQRQMRWLADGIGGDQAVADYQRRGIRARLTGVQDLPELAATDSRLRTMAQPDHNQPTIWWSFSTHFGASWSSILKAAAQSGATTRDEVVRALYGEDIPPAGLWISFGKPMISSDIAPVLMLEETQCYWVQRPGFNLDDAMLRQILYDMTYVRRTWKTDKRERYAEVVSQRASWEQAPTFGIGRRLGSYWYPQALED